MISSRTKCISRRTPAGTACPTVSATQMRRAPHRIALAYSARMVSGRARVVSSVTNITGRPCETANVTAASLAFSIFSSVQSSAYCRIGEEPMKVAASIGIPTFWETSTIGSMSPTTVRAAQLGAMASRASRISVASVWTWSRTRGPAPGNPMSAAAMPRSAMRCRSRSFCSSDGSRAIASASAPWRSVPNEMQLTVTPSRPTSAARPRVNPIAAAFAAP